jgi:hypothetical protein
MLLNYEREGMNRIGDDRCQYLRWKGMFIETTWDPTVPHGYDRSFWCSRTMINIGPDNIVADEYECNETRKCYDAL